MTNTVSFYLLEIVPVTVIKKIVSGKYSPVRRTQTLAVIFSRKEFLEKNGAPYNIFTD